jgi:hypothetical protein
MSKDILYKTDEKLKSYLDTNQLHREEMCVAILSLEKDFSKVHSRQPRGGPDGGRDIEATYKGNQLVYGAIGFINQANDSNEQKKVIRKKFRDDLKSILSNEIKPSVFVFFTNLNLTVHDKDTLIKESKRQGVTHCEIFDREQLKLSLNSPDGFAIRFQYLNIPLSVPEQKSFFTRWGDDIQSVISTGFQKTEDTLNRLLFLQEANDPITTLTLSLELDRTYPSEDIGHFRLFCHLSKFDLALPIHTILWGSSDKSERMNNNINECDILKQPTGIKYGRSSGQWEQHFKTDADVKSGNEDNEEKYVCTSSSSSIGLDEVTFLNITYHKQDFFMIPPYLSLKDIDNAWYIIFLNKSLALKVKTIHVYSNGYKLNEYQSPNFMIDYSECTPDIPMKFFDKELEDSWVKIRPKELSIFPIRFYEETPKRLFPYNQVTDSLANKRRYGYTC